MTSLFRTGKSCGIFATLALLFLLVPVNNLFAGLCPHLPGNLKQKIAEVYPDYTVREYSIPDDAVLKGESCYYLIKLSQSSFAISLVHNETGEKKVIVAESLLYGNMTGWFISDIGSFDREIPLLEPAKAGMYLDIEKKKYFVITRNCQAFNIMLLPSGREYVYEFMGKGDVKKYRIR